jgi:hypothetical protein
LHPYNSAISLIFLWHHIYNIIRHDHDQKMYIEIKSLLLKFLNKSWQNDI